MKAEARRLERIEAGLSPREAALLWLEEAQQFSTLADQARAIKNQPLETFPLYRLPRMVEDATRRSMKGQHPDVVKRAVRAAVRDVAFLFHLAGNANIQEMRERRANWLHLVLLIKELQRLLAERTWDAVMTKPWLELAAAVLQQVYALEGAIDLISGHYFSGRTPLFPEAADNLHQLVEETEQVVGMYNDVVECDRAIAKRAHTAAMPSALDLAGTRKAMRPAARELARHLVTMAQADALDMIGERQRACDLVARLL